MNWVGGARSRLKFQGDRRLQKEFFERKKLDLRCEKLLKASYCHSSKNKKKKVSQDLVALHTVSNASMKAGNSPRGAQVQHIDLDHRRPAASLTRGVLDYRGPGCRMHKAPENVQLPFSPELFPSKLQLRGSLSPSANVEEKHGRAPFKRKSKEPGMSSSQEMDSNFQTVPNPNQTTLGTHKNEEGLFQTPKRMRTLHSPPQLPMSQYVPDRCTTSNASKSSNRTTHCFQPLAFGTNLSQTDALRSRNPWTEEFGLFDLKQIHDKFQSPLCASEEPGGRNHSKVSHSVDQGNWVPYKYPFSQSRLSTDACSSEGDQTLKEHRDVEQLSHKTPTVHKQAEHFENPHSSLSNMWARKDLCSDPKYRIALSPMKMSAQLTPKLSIHTSTRGSPTESPVVDNAQRYKQLQSGRKQVRNDVSRTLPAFGDQFTTPSKLKSISQTPPESCRAERQPSHLKHPTLKPSLFLDHEEDDRRLKIKRLWMPEDFQLSPCSSDRKASQETPQISLSAYTPSFQKPFVSKWESFLESPDKRSNSHLSRFNIPHTPTPNLWKTPSLEQPVSSACYSSDSRAKDSKITSSYARAMLKPSDSETSSTRAQRSENKSTESPEMYRRSGKSLLTPTSLSPSSLHYQTRNKNRCTRTSNSHTSVGQSDFDRTLDHLHASREPQMIDTKGRRDDNEKHSSTATSGRNVLTTPVNSVLNQQPLRPPTPKLWPKDKNLAEKVLQELEQLDAESDHENKRIGSTRKEPSPEPVALIKHWEQQVKKAQEDRAKCQAEHDDVVPDSHDSKSACNPSTDAGDDMTSLVSQEGSITSSSTSDDDNKEQSQDPDSESDTDAHARDISVLECGESSDAESDHEGSIHTAVEDMVHKVVMEENRHNLTDVQRTERGKSMKLMWSSSDTDLQHDPDHSINTVVFQPQMLVIDPVHREKIGVNPPEPQRLSVHAQTDWSLVHADVPSDRLYENPVKNGVDQGTQWESPTSWPCNGNFQQRTVTAQWPSGQHGAPAVPLTFQPALSAEEQKLREEAPAFQSPRHTSTPPPLVSSHTSAVNCQKVSAVKTRQNLSEVSTVNNPSINSMGFSMANVYAHGLKTPDFSKEKVCSEERSEPLVDPVDLSIRKYRFPQISATNLPVQGRKTLEVSVEMPHISSLNFSSDSLKIPDIPEESMCVDITEITKTAPQNVSINKNESPHMYIMNLFERKIPKVSVEIPDVFSADDLKRPDIVTESACAEKMKIPLMTSVNLPVQKNEPPQTATRNESTEQMKIPKVSTTNATTTEDRDKSKLQCSEPYTVTSEPYTVTESRTPPPECQEEHTESLNQPTPQSKTVLPSPKAKRSEMVTRSDQKTDLLSHDSVSHLLSTPEQTTAQSSSSHSAYNVAGMVWMDKVRNSAIKLTTTSNRCTAQDSSLKRPTGSPERTTAGALAPSMQNVAINKDEPPDCSSNTNHDYQLVNKGATTTTSLPIKENPTKSPLNPGVALNREEPPVHLLPKTDLDIQVANNAAATTLLATTGTHTKSVKSPTVQKEEPHVSSSNVDHDFDIANNSVATTTSLVTMEHHRKSVLSPGVAFQRNEPRVCSFSNVDGDFLSHGSTAEHPDQYRGNVSSYTIMVPNRNETTTPTETMKEKETRLLPVPSQTCSSCHTKGDPTRAAEGEQDKTKPVSSASIPEPHSVNASSDTDMNLKRNDTPDLSEMVTKDDPRLLLEPSQTSPSRPEKKREKKQSLSSASVPEQDFRVSRPDGTKQRESVINSELKDETDLVVKEMDDGEDDLFFTPKEGYSSP